MNNIFYILLFFFTCHFLADASAGEFNKGYFHAKLEDKFPDAKIEFDLSDSEIVIYSCPEGLQPNIERFFDGYPQYKVFFDPDYVPLEDTCEPLVEEGDFLPELNPFFPTMLAQPHIIGYSAGYRSYDRTFKISCLPVSIGDQFSLYQFKTETCGRLYFGIEACVWAVFEARAKSLSLINADYFVALPFTYIHNRFSARLRIFHESSHLGDEFLLENRKIDRLNPSMEVVDFALSYDFSPSFTGFLGFSRVIRSDDGFKVKPHGVYYGFNYFLDCYKIKICNLEATPFIATYFSNFEHHNWGLDS